MDLRPYLDELERFADGQLSETEQEAFEQRLAQDEQLSAAYEAYEQFTADLRWVAGHETLSQRLRNLDKHLDERQAALVNSKVRTQAARMRWSLLVAGLVLVLGIGAWLLFRPRPLDAEQAWAHYYVPDPGLTEEAAQRTSNPLLVKAMRQYRDGHYSAALHSLRRIPASTLRDDTLLYYTGVMLLRQNEAAAARSYLTRATQQPASVLAHKARYHLAMAQLRTGEWVQARATLQSIAQNTQNPYWVEAQAALQAPELFPPSAAFGQ
jgi:TolA-binding protein